MDWGIGRYEDTAEQLRPAAQVAIDLADPRPGQRLLDLGCGTGNAAMLAAARGADVVAVDPASRLCQVARARAEQAGLQLDVLEGDAATIPLPAGSVEVLVSVFAIIFCPDPVAAAAECARVLGDGGRLVLTAWLPQGGPMQAMTGAMQEMTMAALGVPAGPPGFAWHDPDIVGELLGAHGFAVTASDHELHYTATSIEAFLEAGLEHPMSLLSTSLLEQAGKADVRDAIRDRARQILSAGNLDPGAFRIASSYRALSATRR